MRGKGRLHVIDLVSKEIMFDFNSNLRIQKTSFQLKKIPLDRNNVQLNAFNMINDF